MSIKTRSGFSAAAIDTLVDALTRTLQLIGWPALIAVFATIAFTVARSTAAQILLNVPPDPAPAPEASARPLFQAVFLIALGMLLFDLEPGAV